MPGIRLSTARKVHRIGALKREGLSVRQIGERLGCSGVNIHLLWKRWGAELDSIPTAPEHSFTPLQCIQRRMALGWKAGELARRAGVSMASIWQFENEELNTTHRWRGLIDEALRDGETLQDAT